MKRWGPIVALAIVLPACGDSDDEPAEGPFSEDSFQDDDIPVGGCNTGSGGCTEGTAGAAGAAVGQPCDGTEQCANDGVCVAPFDAGIVGSLVCQTACVELEDPTRWCSDDVACCSGQCGPRGLCLPAADDSSGSDTTDGGGDNDSADGSGTSG